MPEVPASQMTEEEPDKSSFVVGSLFGFPFPFLVKCFIVRVTFFGSSKDSNMQGYKQSPMSSDILAPPQFTGPPGQLMPYSSNTLPIGQNYAVYGENVQILQFLLKPGESVESEKGAMVYKAQDIEMKVSFNGMFGRILGGEKLSVYNS